MAPSYGVSRMEQHGESSNFTIKHGQGLEHDDNQSLVSEAPLLLRTDYSGLPHRPFPSKMRAHGEMTRGKTFLLCDATTKEDIFCLEVHTGFSASKPLETRPGIVLHDGLSKRDPILAAAGDESPAGIVIAQMSRTSLVFCPPLEPGRNFVSFDRERMSASSDALHSVVFKFSLISEVTWMRENFEWRKFEEGLGGFELFRTVSGRRSDPGMARAQSSTVSSSSSIRGDCSHDAECHLPGRKEEKITVLRWNRFWSGFTLNGYFELDLEGSAASGELSQRLLVVIVITAARLWLLRLRGRTTTAYTRGADVLRQNKEKVQ